MLAKLSKFFNRYLERAPLRFISITIIAVAVAVLILSCLTPVGHKTILGTDIGYDYSAFYIAGTILNEYGANRLYDMKLQADLQRELRPYWPADKTMACPYPPFFALVFQPLARLPFVYSYLAWLVISAGLYLTGLLLIFRTMRPIPGCDWLTCALLALSFEPFILECWLGGQSSAVGFFGMALAYYLYQRRRNILSGAALGVCLYKPPLLVVILPLLLVARRGKILLGFAVCGLVLAMISVLGVGWHGCAAWFEVARVRASGVEILPTHKYIDLFAFWQLLFGRPSQTTRVLLLGAYALWFAAFIFFLRKFKTDSPSCRTLVLASVISWTAVVNIYFPVYDSVIVVIGLLLTLDALYAHFGDVGRTFSPVMKAFLIAIYIIPGASQQLAEHTGFQPYTLILVLLGIYQLFLLRETSETSAAAEMG
jgi:Glycosyltransferase family 87